MDMIQAIAGHGHLGLQEMGRCAQVCKEWNRRLQQPLPWVRLVKETGAHLRPGEHARNRLKEIVTQEGLLAGKNLAYEKICDNVFPWEICSCSEGRILLKSLVPPYDDIPRTVGYSLIDIETGQVLRWFRPPNHHHIGVRPKDGCIVAGRLYGSSGSLVPSGYSWSLENPDEPPQIVAGITGVARWGDHLVRATQLEANIYDQEPLNAPVYTINFATFGNPPFNLKHVYGCNTQVLLVGYNRCIIWEPGSGAWAALHERPKCWTHTDTHLVLATEGELLAYSLDTRALDWRVDTPQGVLSLAVVGEGPHTHIIGEGGGRKLLAWRAADGVPLPQPIMDSHSGGAFGLLNTPDGLLIKSQDALGRVYSQTTNEPEVRPAKLQQARSSKMIGVLSGALFLLALKVRSIYYKIFYCAASLGTARLALSRHRASKRLTLAELRFD